jgi:hypothetical protein
MRVTRSQLARALLRMAGLLLAAAVLTTSGCDHAPPSTRLVTARADLARARIAGESRFVLPGSQRLPISIPAGAELDLGFGVADRVWERRAAVDFSVSVEGNGTSRAMLQVRVDPAQEVSNQWHDAVLDLGSLAHRRGTLVLAVTAPEGVAAADLVWTDPQVRVPAVPSGANVILVSIDTLRADRLGCYGHR